MGVAAVAATPKVFVPYRRRRVLDIIMAQVTLIKGAPGVGNDVPYGDQLVKAAHHLREGGVAKSVARLERDCAGRCERPQLVSSIGRPWAVGPDRRPNLAPGKLLIIDLWVPCRKCGRCLQARASEWTRRAMVETTRRVRTWFGTLTMDPHWHSLAVMRARSKHSDWSTLTEERQFGALVREVSAELTKYLKRVRKRSGAPLRYILVAEKHSEQLAGLPHFHLLIHELDADTPVRKAVLKDEWKLGFSRWKLADRWSARYVCKYLAKEASTRVRASKDYGREDDRSVVDL